MVEFAVRGGVLIADGHDHDEAALRGGVAKALTADRTEMQAQTHAVAARLSETWYSDEGGFGHDCREHSDAQRGPHCATFQAVTVAEDIPAPARVERIQRAEVRHARL
jgi:hypothetical protein